MEFTRIWDPGGVDTDLDLGGVNTDLDSGGVDADLDPGGVDTDLDPVGVDTVWIRVELIQITLFYFFECKDGPDIRPGWIYGNLFDGRYKVQ